MCSAQQNRLHKWTTFLKVLLVSILVPQYSVVLVTIDFTNRLCCPYFARRGATQRGEVDFTHDGVNEVSGRRAWALSVPVTRWQSLPRQRALPSVPGGRATG